ncbi:MAG: DUF835 domain-containing protein [Thermoplasmata archaeon]
MTSGQAGRNPDDEADVIMTIPREPIVEDRERSCPLCECLVPLGAHECRRCGMLIPSAKRVIKENPKSEKIETRPGLPTMRFRYTYMIKSDVRDLPFDLVLDGVQDCGRGLCITRVFPDIVTRRFGDAEIPVIWLSSTASEDCIRPRDLEKLSLVIEKFIKTGPSVVLLDGIDYLITNNGFKPILRLVQILTDYVSVHNSILLLTVAPGVIDEEDLSVLEREVDEII